MEELNKQIKPLEIKSELPKQEENETRKDIVGNFLHEQGFNGNPNIQYSINVLTAKIAKEKT